MWQKLQEKCRTPSPKPFCVEIDKKNPGTTFRDGILREPAQSKRTWTFHKSHFVWKFAGKRPDPNSGTYVSRAPAQSKRTWTSQMSHFVWKFTGKCRTRIRPPRLDTGLFTLTVRTPSVWLHCLGKNIQVSVISFQKKGCYLKTIEGENAEKWQSSRFLQNDALFGQT